ncbi:zinc finger protein 532-like isoform X2 [Watersipora subatra]|uniref:zinc finger protein 532-like isoform X2 n=1 Tax=Watersipora subatra TaxID=2589382 RepID=UPI00355B5FD5
MEPLSQESVNASGDHADEPAKVNNNSFSNGHHHLLPSTQAQRSISPKVPNRKAAPFNRAFKQAVFEKRGKDDGSSNLHVTFTSPKTAVRPITVAKQLAERDHHRATKPSFGKITGMVNIKPKPKAGPPAYKDIVTIDKKKMQEEIENIPKPEHIVEAEKVLLSHESMKKFAPACETNRDYICLGCGDAFPSQFALDDHMNRQSYQLTLDCPQCLSKCAFNNKCRMYEHLHGEHGMDRHRSLQIASAFVSLQALPRAQVKTLEANTVAGMGADPADIASPFDKMDDGEMEDGMVIDEVEAAEKGSVGGRAEQEVTVLDGRDDLKETKDSEQTAGATSEDEIIIHTPIICNGVSSDEQDNSIACTECSRTFESAWTLQTHFSVPSADDFKPEICIPCKVELVTPCARKAHMRIHGLMEPFVCPDCGERMYRKNVFLKHIRLHCLHYSVLSEYMCPGCADTFSTADEQLVHLKVLPSHLRFERERSYYKCNGCPKAFKSVAAHSKHESCPGAGCTVVHMCNNCPQQTVFRSWSELTQHRSEAHPELVWVPKRSKIYACYLCVHRSRTKQGLLDHLQKSHGKKRVFFMCRYCGVEVDSRQNLDFHLEVCPFKDDAKKIRTPLSIPERQPKLSSSSSVVSDHSSSTAAVEDGGAVNGSTDKDCPGPTMDIPYLAHVPSFNCHMCTAEYNSYSKLRDHVTARHEGRGLIYECWVCRDRGNTSNFYRQSALDKHMTDIHKIQISQTPPEAPIDNGEPSAEESSIKKMRLWNEESQPYQCCRCQCAECGMCFTVQLALRRHLFAVHKVSDYSKYSRSQYMADFERQLHDTQGKCPICKSQFTTEMQLKKHLRTHGMMYINTRRMVPT